MQQTKLSFLTKSLYGIGDMPTACVVGVIGYLLNPFLLNVAGLTHFLVSYIFILKLQPPPNPIPSYWRSGSSSALSQP